MITVSLTSLSAQSITVRVTSCHPTLKFTSRTGPLPKTLPFSDHSYLLMKPSGSTDPDPSKVMVSKPFPSRSRCHCSGPASGTGAWLPRMFGGH